MARPKTSRSVVNPVSTVSLEAESEAIPSLLRNQEASIPLQPSVGGTAHIGNRDNVSSGACQFLLVSAGPTLFGESFNWPAPGC